ncbi:MAG: efflux RND transporter periplasmic adaptor subunit [Thermonemataceae bacterium]|nr:efflux RND transporter periplasmic adaptor subunit [Thermonemataceae bacterium]
MKTSDIYMFLCVLLLACGKKEQSKENTELGTLGARLQQEEILEVETKKVQKKAFNYIIQSNAKVEAKEQAVLQFRSQGYIEKVLVQNGELVTAGQVIAILDSREAQLALEKAKNQRAVAYEEYIKEVLDYGGDLALENMGLKAELNERILARKGVRAAELAIKEASLQLSYTQLKAPFSGIISDCSIKAGNFISSSQSVCTLYGTRDLQAITEILESELTVIKIGQEAQIIPINCQEEKQCILEGVVTEINPKIGINGLFRVKISIKKPEGIFLGTNLQVKIEAPQRNTLLVSKKAIVIRSGRKVVFSVENGLAKWNYVKTGLENTEEVEILEGLSENQVIIVSNNLQLNHDSPVRTKK